MVAGKLGEETRTQSTTKPVVSFHCCFVPSGTTQPGFEGPEVLTGYGQNDLKRNTHFLDWGPKIGTPDVQRNALDCFCFFLISPTSAAGNHTAPQSKEQR